MRKAFVITLAIAMFAALASGGTWLWMRRPWRVVATVDGDTLTSRDLDIRVETYGGDRREIVRAWIAKQLLLGEAVRRNVLLEEGDEREVKSVLVAWLASRGTTADGFFAQGPLPEDVKRNDFKEGLLVHALVTETLRKENGSFAEFYRSLHAKASVQCPEFPALERGDGPVPLYVGFWGWAPARVSVVAAGQVLTSAELDLRVRNTQDDLRRRNMALPTLEVLRRHEAQTWIYKVVMQAEAVRRNVAVTPDDEKKERARMGSQLLSHKLTVEQFFKEGVLPESLKVEDFRSNIRVNKFLAREVDGKINFSTPEIEACMADLRRRADEEAARGMKPTTKSDRKTAVNQLHQERHNRGCRVLFRSLFSSARVWSPEFPEMERVDGVSPPFPDERNR